MSIVVDGFRFTVQSSVMLHDYSALIVSVQEGRGGAPKLHLRPVERTAFEPFPTPPPSPVLERDLMFIRSNSWGGLFRLCFQSDSTGYLQKLDNYTRGTFVKMELQHYLCQQWSRLPVSRTYGDTHPLCIQAYSEFNHSQTGSRMIPCPNGTPDLSSIEFVFDYTYSFQIQNLKVMLESQYKAYSAMTYSQRRAHNPRIQHLTRGVSTDPSIVFNPTECTVSAKIYRIQVKGVCPVFFYYGIFGIVTRTKKDDNPVEILPVDQGNRFIPLISVPRTRLKNETYDAYGLYDRYAQGFTQHIGKVLEYVQLCAKPNKRCSNNYVLNDEYVDVPEFVEIHRATNRKFSRRYRPFTSHSGINVRTYPKTQKIGSKLKWARRRKINE